jgi:hypothetical protein
MWSDTGNERYESRGDVQHKINLDSFNLSGPNMSQSRLIGKINVPHAKDGHQKSLIDTASTVSSVA